MLTYFLMCPLCYRSKEEEYFNEEAGHLLRTKPLEDNEGGFLTGFATVDNPFLI